MESNNPIEIFSNLDIFITVCDVMGVITHWLAALQGVQSEGQSYSGQKGLVTTWWHHT